MVESKVEAFADLWQHKVEWLNRYLNTLSDDELTHSPAPDRNHGIWMLAHIISDEDSLSYYLGKEEIYYPEYQEVFHPSAPVLPVDECPEPALLREQWQEMEEKNKKVFQQLTDQELADPHELFDPDSGQPIETKQLCIMNRILHVAHHAGQLALIASNLGYKVFQVEG